MPQFYEPGSYKFRSPPRAPDLPPLMRLRRAGLREDEQDEVIARWRAMSNAERFESGEAMDNLDDDELARQVVEMREEMEAERAAAEYATDPEPPKRRGRKPKGT